MDLVLDIGNFRIKGALFEEDNIVEFFSFPPEKEALKNQLDGKQITSLLISSVTQKGSSLISEALNELGLPFHLLDFSTVNVKLEVDEPEEVGHDRIANVYGALFRFPQNDCIVVDLGTAVTFDVIGKEGIYLGGAIYPGVDIGAKALGEYTDKLPHVTPKVAPDSVAKTTAGHIQSGLYWGLLGAIERITYEMRSISDNPNNVKVIATGGLLKTFNDIDFTKALSDLVDLIDPALTLIGIHEIMKEQKEKYHV
ncbi:MAG: Type III pantothenate kinase [Chlamydiae bacterium]|nr:Type III pantothenate kinase [Chlamydiota bacterium]